MIKKTQEFNSQRQSKADKNLKVYYGSMVTKKVVGLKYQ